MPLVMCVRCGVSTYSAARWSSVDCCPSCGTDLRPRSDHSAADATPGEVRRLLTDLDDQLERTAGELEALERRMLELRREPVGDGALDELEALLARTVVLRSTLQRGHASASLMKAFVASRLVQLEDQPRVADRPPGKPLPAHDARASAGGGA